MKSNIPYLRHILDSIQAISSFVQGMSLEDFKNDRKTLSAVVREFEVIGEATRKIDIDFRAQYPDIPWQLMVAMRNFLAHEYMNIKPHIIWKTTSEQLPDLEIQISKLIENLSK